MFSREVFALLLGQQLISQALVEKIAGWRHSDLNVHSRVRAQSKKEAKLVGKYMIRPLLLLERLSFEEKEGKVSYRYSKEGEEKSGWIIWSSSPESLPIFLTGAR